MEQGMINGWTNLKTFNFEENQVEIMNLEVLKRTREETDIYGAPLQGIHHYQAIERIEQICIKYNLNYSIDEIFAAQNKNKSHPGVALIPSVEEEYGKKAVEAHVLRRIYTTIHILNWEDDELTTAIALAVHQDGLQAAIGPNVKICHNQCVLSADRYVTNFGKNKVSTDELFETIDKWLSVFETEMTEDRERIRKMKNRIVSPQEIYQIIGALTIMRVAHDSSDKNLVEKVETYPLNQSQITLFTESILKQLQKKEELSVWDLYNAATEIYKPGKADIPAMLPQNIAFVDMISKHFLN